MKKRKKAGRLKSSRLDTKENNFRLWWHCEKIKFRATQLNRRCVLTEGDPPVD